MPCCGRSSSSREPTLEFPQLAESADQIIQESYDVIVIGSGYGGGIAACRAARAGNSVCVLERGKEWRPGDFPEDSIGVLGEVQLKTQGCEATGNGLELYNINMNDDVVIVTGNGLGGTSLINANVSLAADRKVLDNVDWPIEFREDLDNFPKHMRSAKDMLRPRPYKKYCLKTEQMGKIADHILKNGVPDIEDLTTTVRKSKVTRDTFFYQAPLYVNMVSKKKNHVGVPQPACNGCGNCMGGCNTGAKNTVNMNYLPDAKYHGTEIFTKVKVQYVQESPLDDGSWQVIYKKHGKDEPFIVSARIVIVAAGTLGSNEIMLRSKEHGLEVSDRLGEDYSSNGDDLGISWNGKEETNSIGIPSDHNPKKNNPPPGPCIVNVLDFRKLFQSKDWRQGFLVEDGTPALGLSAGYKALLYIGSLLFTHDETQPDDTWRQLADKLTGDAPNKTLALLGIGYDNLPDKDENVNAGTITLDKDGVKVTWKNAHEKENYKRLEAAYKKSAEALGATYMEDPLSSDGGKIFDPLLTGKNTISVHPLGGCCMGDTGITGVVNHKGQVFIGNTDDVHEGLYIMDGSILPSAVGVNPVLTISAVAERCMSFMAKDQNWGPLDYSFVDNPETIMLHQQKKPGLKVTEVMKGKVTLCSNNQESYLKSILDLKTNDLEDTLEADNHPFEADGVILCKDLSKKPMTARGSVEMFTESDSPDLQLMVYQLNLVPTDSKKRYFLYGVKHLKDDKPPEIGYSDGTTLFITVHEGTDKNGKVLIKGQIKFHLKDIMKAIASITITNPHGGFLNSLYWKMKFIKMFMEEFWDIYSPFASNKPTPTSRDVVRKKRPLNLPDKAQPRVFKYATGDKKTMRVIRYRGGPAGPIVLVAGLGVNTGIFSLDTIPCNIVEYLTKRGFDVWLLQWRINAHGPHARTQYNLDECAKYDIPAGIDRILDITKFKSVQVLAYGVGSMLLWSSLLGGHLDPKKIRSIVASQVAFTPVPSSYNKIRGKAYIGDTSNAADLDFYDVLDEDETLGEKVFDVFVQNAADAVVPYNEMCKNKVCHRCTFMYGLMWEHDNLNVQTHKTLHEIFGLIKSTMTKHIQQNMTEEKLTSCDGESEYMPGFKWASDISKLEVPENVNKFCNIPTLLFNGSKNSVFDPENLNRTHAILKKAHPDQHFERIQIEGYGHLDCLIGKNAKEDVFPKLMPFLNTYAHGNMKANEKAVKLFCESLLKGKKASLPDGWRQQLKAKGVAVKDENDNEIDGDEDTDDSDSDEDETETSFTNKGYDDGGNEKKHEKKADCSLCGLHSQRVKTIEWRRKIKQDKVELDDNDTYEEVEFESNSEKRAIYVLTDLHMRAYTAMKPEKRLDKLINFLRARSHRAYALVMTGDILEYWYDPHHEVPPSLEELREKFKTGEGIPGMQKFQDIIRELTEQLSVKVYFVRGNHDRDITDGIVAEIFEKRVKFVLEKLVLGIKEDGVTYYAGFEHGHQWDLYNNYVIKDNHLRGHVLGYFVARLAASSKYEAGCCSKYIQEVLPGILRHLPLDFLGSLAMKLASWSFISGRITKALMEEAFMDDVDDDMEIVLRDGSKIKIEEILDFPLIEKSNDQFGSDRTWDMVKGSLGDYTGLIEQATEDVVVVGHSHFLGAHRQTGKYRKSVIYANPGCWTDKCEGNVSIIEVEAPWKGRKKGNGVVQILRLGE